VDPDATVLPQGSVPVVMEEPEEEMPANLMADVDEDELHRRRTNPELFKVTISLIEVCK
jgi:hypothetical protein